MSRKAWLAIAMVVVLAFPALAQNVTVTGTVIDPDGEPAIGASVTVKGQSTHGVATDLDGNFRISAAPNATLVVSMVGAAAQEVPLAGRTHVVVNLKGDSQVLSELVVIGYGSVKKEDATGSVAVVKPDEIEAGLATSVQDMLVGQTPGVVVTTSGGPEGNATIRVRGGSSLNASNDPLIVIDGVPLDNGGVWGMSNPLSMLSPESIESMTVLKDASATAIYGSRASNGVIIVTTKKGASGKPKVNFSANVYVNTVAKTWDVLDSNEFANFIKANFPEASAARLGYNGKLYSTDWQKEVTRTTVSSDYSLSVAGTTKNTPYRVDASYMNSNGIIKGSDMNRATLGASLTPKLFDDHLSINANVHGYYIHNNFSGGGGAVGAALGFDPTKPVYTNIPISYGDSGQKYLYGGYFTWNNISPDGTVAVEQNAGRNPMSYVRSLDNHSDVLRSNGNLQLDYRFHFLPELRANLNLGYDITSAREWDIVEQNSPNTYWSHQKNGAGFANYRKQFKSNTLLDFYLNYRKEFDDQNFDIMAGYSWQRFYKRERNFGSSSEAGRPTTAGFYMPTFNAATGQYSLNINPETISAIGKNYADDMIDPAGNYHYAEHLQLLSFFGRLNYSFKNRYLLTATVRGDATSRFSKDNRWGVFPSVALGWRIDQEAFMESVRPVMNEFKLRLGWGMTGQQEVGSTNNYLPMYKIAAQGSYYPATDVNGNIVYLPGYFLQGYNPDLKWETTTTYNGGFDFGFLNNRITANIDGYYRKTTDLLSFVTIPAGSSTVNMLNRNIGDLENYGVEFSITARPVVTKDFTWNVSYNVGWNHNEITALNDASTKILTGGISGGTGNTIKAYMVGHNAGAFNVLQQVYDAAGNPIEGVFVDQNNDGVINSDDRVLRHSSDPVVTMTMSHAFRYKSWDLGFALRASLGNYVYNNVLASNTALSSVDSYGLNNVLKHDFYFKDKSAANYYFSDYFLENGSYLRCDNITLGYTWENLLQDSLRLRLFGAVQNPFVITKYRGLDPEVSGGIDNNVYPRSTTYSIGLVATF